MSRVGDYAVSEGAGCDHGAVQQPTPPRTSGRTPLQRVLVVGGRGWVTTLTDDGPRVESLRVAWQLDEFAAALDVEMPAEVRVLDEIGPGDVVPGTVVIGAGSGVRALSGTPGGPLVIQLGLGSSTGLPDVVEARLAGGIELDTYQAWQQDPEANYRMLGRIDVAEHMGAHITLRTDAYCSFWLDGTPGLPRLVARYLEAYVALAGPT